MTQPVHRISAMASDAPLILDYQERIAETLESLGIAKAAAAKTFDKIEAVRESGLHLHPTYNFKVSRNGQPLFFRALVRNDHSLRVMRRRTTHVLQQIESQLATHRRKPFVVLMSSKAAKQARWYGTWKKSSRDVIFHAHGHLHPNLGLGLAKLPNKYERSKPSSNYISTCLRRNGRSNIDRR
jgi:hypothetical protein